MSPQFDTRTNREQLLDHLPDELRAGLEHAIEMEDDHGRFALSAVDPAGTGTMYVLQQGGAQKLEGMPRAYREAIFTNGKQLSDRPITLPLGPEQQAWEKAVSSLV